MTAIALYDGERRIGAPVDLELEVRGDLTMTNTNEVTWETPMGVRKIRHVKLRLLRAHGYQDFVPTLNGEPRYGDRISFPPGALHIDTAYPPKVDA